MLVGCLVLKNRYSIPNHVEKTIIWREQYQSKAIMPMDKGTAFATLVFKSSYMFPRGPYTLYTLRTRLQVSF